jgi:hypothetical protein
MFAHMSLSIEPAWPGVSPGTAWALLAVAALVLAALTVWTYLGVRGGSTKRVVIVLALRLIALAVTVLLMLRPSLAIEEENTLDPSRLLLVIDVSKSMSLSDEFGNVSRLKRVQDLLAGAKVKAALQRLADEKKVEVVLYQAADELRRYDASVKADGKSTDVSHWLDDLRREGMSDIPVQAVMFFSDGVDTGEPVRTLQRAAEFRGKWPFVTFGLGSATGTGADKDIALDQIIVEPLPILAKGKVAVKVNVQSPGFDGATTDFSLWFEDRAGKKEMQTRKERLALPADNIVTFEADAPDTDGEIKITVKAKPIPGEATDKNNEISTYAYVSKEGVRILWVDKLRAWEPVTAMRALTKDRRFRVYPADNTAGPPKGPDPYKFENTPPDVLVIGDVSPSRFGDAETLKKVRKLVEKQGMGVVMLGGQETFSGDWQESPLGDIFPFRFDRTGQIESKFRVVPKDPEGLQFLCRLSDDPKKNQEIWKNVFAPLEGMNQPGTLDKRSTIFATRDGNDAAPVLVGTQFGAGRVLAFPVDTTWQWRRSPEAVAAYERFWRQMMLWLARQENTQGVVFVQLDERRLERPTQLRYQVGFRGVEVDGAKFSAKIIGPRGEEYPVSIGSDPRGVWTPPAAGEYTFHVEGNGKTALGLAIEGRDLARFLVIETDREMLRPAADHDFLQKLAAATDGKFFQAQDDKLLQAIAELQARQAPAQSKITYWPDWRKAPPSGAIGDQFATLWRSTALFALIVYIACLCLEWYLRRRWGMV